MQVPPSRNLSNSSFHGLPKNLPPTPTLLFRGAERAITVQSPTIAVVSNIGCFATRYKPLSHSIAVWLSRVNLEPPLVTCGRNRHPTHSHCQAGNAFGIGEIQEAMIPRTLAMSSDSVECACDFVTTVVRDRYSYTIQIRRKLKCWNGIATAEKTCM